MKTKSTLTLLATGALLLGSIGLTQAEEKERPKGGKGDGSFFKTMDTNGDKSISKEEAGDKWERLGKLDKDGDGSVNVQELMAARGGKGKGKPGEKPEGKDGERPKGAPRDGGPGEMFKRADKNNDGKISKDEVPERAWERLGKLDTDGDGAVSGEEAKAGRPEGGRPGEGRPGGPPSKEEAAERFAKADKNGDGKLSKDEVPAEHWERLGKLDKDGDNAVSKEEMAALAAMMRERGGKGGREGGKGKGKGDRPDGGPGAMFDRFDKDEDGKLAESEVPEEMWAKVRKADDDADGLVSKAEFDKVMSRRDGRKPGGDKPEGGEKKKRPALEGDTEA
ncbi:MAG: EF-hand domain-containing protein [Verrucomicrobiales bacterium]|nr:EF-hand domain-containing protein [Verrucomicrobiales bacterium]